MNLSRTTKQERTSRYSELKEKIKSLMHRNPQIQVRDIVAETGYSEYMVMRAYLPARRELFARLSR